MILRIAFLSLTCLLASCGSLLKLFPEKPVLSEKERSEWETAPAHNVDYQGNAQFSFPIIPAQIWGVTYDLDIIMVSKHPYWNMHEYARVKTPNSEVWFAKDADNKELKQRIISNDSENYHLFPEIPIQRKRSDFFEVRYGLVNKKGQPLTTEQDSFFNFYIRYENYKEEEVTAEYFGKMPSTAQPKRNGSTMGHSREDLIAVLDLPLRDFGKKASIAYHGKPYKMKKLLGIVPFQMALSQTQAGLSRVSFSQRLVADDSTKVFMNYSPYPFYIQKHTIWQIRDTATWQILENQDSMRTIRYFFNKNGQYLELSHATVQQWNSPHETCRISFFPPLPDMRYNFDERYMSNFTIDVNGQKNHAAGSAEVYCGYDKTEAALHLMPKGTWWTEDRVTSFALRRYPEEKSVSEYSFPGAINLKKGYYPKAYLDAEQPKEKKGKNKKRTVAPPKNNQINPFLDIGH